MHAELIVEVLNYVGIVAFAVSGALKAGEKDMDLLGFVVLGFSTALAGGIIRDVLLGRVPPTNITYLPPPNGDPGITRHLFLYPQLRRYRDAVLYPDAVGLGAFSAIGADITATYCSAQVGDGCWLTVAVLSALTAAGGGIVRDVLAAEIPTVLRREVYATAAATGGLVYLAALPLGRDVAMVATILVVTAVRLLSLWRGWELPRIAKQRVDV
jgi:uncharacterized membrane protein YeiH